ncbi:MAG: hypothetical protein IJQ84_06020 [Paludibacteraceae bacterium]|nr:hypothetical protein [Paludibacteraceae bacterium]MBR0065409.1 hypothetical protein [Paludibacteraceae bacterium]
MHFVIDDIIEENKRRLQVFATEYNPITGEGCDSCERLPFKANELGYDWLVPFDCYDEKIFRDIRSCDGSIREYLHRLGLRYTRVNLEEVRREIIKARCRHDFEYCAASYFYIKDKNPLNPKDILFVLNRGQRRLLKKIYACDKYGKPVRVIIVKSRQIGFSTLIQLYMAWKQLFVLGAVNSVIVAHVENTARIIRGMYSKMLNKLPVWLIGKESMIDKLALTPFERGNKTLIVKGVGCRITIGSAEKPNNIVGDDILMAHFSEVGLYKTTQGIKPEQLVQSIMGGISYAPNTMIFYESTARGVGNFFHTEWLHATTDDPVERSVFDPLFVPWFDADNDRLAIDDYTAFIKGMNEYERWLFEIGATLEGIAWYRDASRQMKDQWRWKSERPSSATEAFQTSGHRLYPQADVERLRKNCRKPMFVGDVFGKSDYGDDALKDIEFREMRDGPLKIWFMPDDNPEKQCNDRYIIVVDVGGTSDHSDRSVICVFDRYDMVHGGVPIVVAEWCGHCPHYQLAWKSVQMATKYGHGLLVIESNTLETEQTEGVSGEYVLDEIALHYDNLYCRIPLDKINMGFEPKWGFQTNKSTKPRVCKHQQKVLAKDMYIETCKEAADEHDFMEIKPNGKAIGAIEGQHDDRHITRAIGVWICYDELNIPRKAKPVTRKEKEKMKVVGLSTI